MKAIETISKKAMHPSGAKVLNIETIAFLAHSEADIQALVENHYKMKDFPEANMQTTFWSWGYYQITPEINKLIDAERNEHSNCFCMAREGGPPNKSYSGALVHARKTFEIFKNNYDVQCFIKFEVITEASL